MPLLEPGQTVNSTYEVERFLGEGAFAEVYRAAHRFLGRQAMKVFKRPGMTPDEIDKMLGEAVLLSRIGHPNVVRVFDANTLEAQGNVHGFFTMENIPGGSLDRFWRSHGNEFIEVGTVVDLMKQACRGLALAHGEDPPIVHRDIKPQNMLVGYETDGLRVRVSDFGLAKTVNPLTLMATSAGTLCFKPPEAFEDRRGDSCSGDVWALGVTLYLLLTDHLPFAVEADLGWANREAFKEKYAPPGVFNLSVDAGLESTLDRCLMVAPEERFQNATELLEALKSWSDAPQQKNAMDSTICSSSESKAVLGQHSPIDREKGERLAAEALAIARQASRLFEAADLMEEAFNSCPELRQRYADKVRLWRCGVSM